MFTKHVVNHWKFAKLSNLSILYIKLMLLKFHFVLIFRTIRIDARKYNFAEEHIKSPIMSKKICQHVKLLNINSIYWISGNRFRQCLGYMLNLESLYALDTALGVTSTDLKVYRKLEKVV